MNGAKRRNPASTVRDANLFLVWKTVFENRPVTVDNVSLISGLSRPTVLAMLDELSTLGIIEKSGLAKSSGGRQPVLYSPAKEAWYAVGIDMDFPVFRLSITDFTGNPIYNSSLTADTLLKPDSITEKLVTMISDAVAASGVLPEKIIGCGIGFPGSVDIATGTALRSSRLHGWRNVPLSDIISDRTGFRCYVRSNAHLLALAEKSRLGDGFGNMLYFIDSYTLGLAVFIDGKLWEGAFGNAGSIAHTPVDRNGPMCECGRRGCAELYCSKTAIEKEYAKIRWSSSQSCAPYEKIIRLADSFGDEVAISILENAGKIYGELISGAMQTFDIPCVVLGGIGCDEDSLFFRTVSESVRACCGSVFHDETKLFISKLPESEYGVGACMYVIDSFAHSPAQLFGRRMPQ